MRLAPDIQGTLGGEAQRTPGGDWSNAAISKKLPEAGREGGNGSFPRPQKEPSPAHTSSLDIQPLTCGTRSFCRVSHCLWHFVTVALTKENVLETA